MYATFLYIQYISVFMYTHTGNHTDTWNRHVIYPRCNISKMQKTSNYTQMANVFFFQILHRIWPSGEQRLLLVAFSFNGLCAIKIKSEHYNFTREVTNTLGIFRNSCKSGFTFDEIGVNYQ